MPKYGKDFQKRQSWAQILRKIVDQTNQALLRGDYSSAMNGIMTLKANMVHLIDRADGYHKKMANLDREKERRLKKLRSPDGMDQKKLRSIKMEYAIKKFEILQRLIHKKEVYNPEKVIAVVPTRLKGKKFGETFYGKKMIGKNIKERFRKNKNWLGVFVGGVGLGKSYSAMTISKLIDSSFNLDRVCFKASQFRDCLERLKDKSKGKFIIFDEAGVEVASREWYSKRNKAISYITQTFRKKQFGVIFTTPNLTYIDKQVRGLFNNYARFDKIDEDNELAFCDWRTVIPKGNEVEPYTPMPRIKDRKGYRKKIGLVKIPHPYTLIGKDFLTKYEKRKTNFVNELIKRELSEKEEVKLEDIIEEVKENLEKYLKEWGDRKIVKKSLVKHEYEDLTWRDVEYIKTKIEKEIN